MKLEEMFRTGFGSPEDEIEPHSRSSADIDVKISFAHEQGNEEAFAQLQNLPAFKVALEEQWLSAYRSLAQQFIAKSAIRPGYGWMDDLECEVSIVVGSPQHVE